MIWVTWVCDTSDMAFSPKGMIWVLLNFERIRLSRYCAAIRERNSCLYRTCKKNILCSKYTINSFLYAFVNLKLINYRVVPLSFSSYKTYLCSHDEYKAWISPMDTLSSNGVKVFVLLYP